MREKYNDFSTDITVTDQFGNETTLKNIVFRGDKRPKTILPQPVPESLIDIDDPTEKAVVAILNDEVNRYKECGRRVGGLGSVHTVYKGRTQRGIGTEWREADSSEQQNIVPDPQETTIGSDNLEKILGIFEELDEKQRQDFINVLLSRLDKDTEYAPIGYFMVLVLLKIGQFDMALQKAKKDLSGDHGYGFCDSIRLIDGLLRLKHDPFTEKDLVSVVCRTSELHSFPCRRSVERVRSATSNTPHVNNASNASATMSTSRDMVCIYRSIPPLA